MLKAPIPWNEQERLDQLLRLNILDTACEVAFDDLTVLASQICNTPISMVSLIDKDRQWIKSKVVIDIVQTPRDVSFCGHVINYSTLFEIPDTHKDDRFKDNPFALVKVLSAIMPECLWLPAMVIILDLFVSLIQRQVS